MDNFHQLPLCHKCKFVLGANFIIHQEKHVMHGKGLIDGETYCYHIHCEPSFITRYSSAKKEIGDDIA